MTTRTWIIAGSAVAAVVTVGLVAAIAGPVLLAQTSPVERKHYTSWVEAPSREEDGPAAKPDWAPTDGRDIDLEYRVRNVAGYTIAMTSATGVDLASCTRLADDHGGAAMASDLLPATMPDRPWTCGDGRAVWQDGDRVWAWSTSTSIETGR